MLTFRVECTEMRQIDDISPAIAPYNPRGPESLCDSLLSVFDDEQLADVCFLFPCGRKIHAQKAVLAASNEYFRASMCLDRESYAH
jgi:hypothetical protein